jgi:uncharacterized membrane protein YkoI
MKNTATLLLLGATMWLLSPTRVLAETFKMPETKMSMEHCLQAALAKRAGEVEKLEFKLKDGTPVYEIEIVDRDDAEWEYECDANSGKIIGEEREVASASIPLFQNKAKITDEAARKTVLDAHPLGEIITTEYEIKTDGPAVYEFDVKTKDGKKVKVEVDAAGGKIVESSQHIYQIGRGPKEMAISS